ncbi:MAG TPA: hypothetical protein VIJ50_05315 [Solirubrobacteraceae bacterium]
MSKSPYACISVALLVALVVLMSAQAAFGLFTAKAAGGSITLATATLSAPKSIKAAQTKCKSNHTPEILVEWTATSSAAATEYAIERSTSSNGPYAEVASLPISQHSYTDSSSQLGYSTTYYYRVSVTVESWSAASSSVSVKTLGKLCI